jgi:hypothetical protein
MKSALWVFLILGATAAWAQKAKYNPSDYTVNIHVESSGMKLECGDVTNGSSFCFWQQSLKVTVDGKKLELRGNAMPKDQYILKLGDCKARVLKEDVTRSYGYQRTYQLLFPDGKVGEYLVVGESE